MPNYCDFDMRIKGGRKNVLKLASWLSADYCYSKERPEVFLDAGGTKIPVEHHIGWRIFEVYYDSTDFVDLHEDTDITLYLNGYCAWSVYSCMFEGPFTYYSDNHQECLEKYGKDFSITLPDACKELSLEVELFSNEPGMCFAEHYHISSDGEILTEEEAPYMEYYIEEYDTYETFAESFEEKCPIQKTEFEHSRKEGESCVICCPWLKDGSWPFELV